MTLGKFRNFDVEVFRDDLFSMNSTDNANSYSFQYIEDKRSSTKIGVRLLDEQYEVVVSAILGGSRGITGVHPACGLVDNDNVLLCVSNNVYCLELPSLKLLWRTDADEATCFEICGIPDGYIVHGELRLSRLDKSGRVVWSRLGADIFTTPYGKDEFEVADGVIKVLDWNGTLYRFDLDGKPLS
jgi:hypothetical protein